LALDAAFCNAILSGQRGYRPTDCSRLKIVPGGF